MTAGPVSAHGEKTGGAASRVALVQVWTMRTAGLDEASVAPWLAMLDAGERKRAARFLRPESRIEFVAAHALLRMALGRLAGLPPAALHFAAGRRGKPFLAMAGAAPRLSFNVSHTKGLVGLAAIAQADRALGFDLESLARKVDLAVAGRYFSPPEVAWLEAQPAAERSAGFLRLWTLKEAFIKATGKGLTQSLAAFSFDPLALGIRFNQDIGESESEWWFEQRRLAGDFVAAIGLRRAPGEAIESRWAVLDPEKIGANGLEPRSPRG